MGKWVDAVHERRILASLLLALIIVLMLDSAVGLGIPWSWFVVALPLVATATAYTPTEHSMSVGLGIVCSVFLCLHALFDPAFPNFAGWFVGVAFTLVARNRCRRLYYESDPPTRGYVALADGSTVPLEFARQCPYDSPLRPCADCAMQNHPYFGYSAIGVVEIGTDALVVIEPDNIPVEMAVMRDDRHVWLRARPDSIVTA